jgi:hypothetical protein
VVSKKENRSCVPACFSTTGSEKAGLQRIVMSVNQKCCCEHFLIERTFLISLNLFCYHLSGPVLFSLIMHRGFVPCWARGR